MKMMRGKVVVCYAGEGDDSVAADKGRSNVLLHGYDDGDEGRKHFVYVVFVLSCWWS